MKFALIKKDASNICSGVTYLEKKDEIPEGYIGIDITKREAEEFLWRKFEPFIGDFLDEWDIPEILETKSEIDILKEKNNQLAKNVFELTQIVEIMLKGGIQNDTPRDVG